MKTAKLGDDILFLDGGLSTEIEALGGNIGSELWSANGLLENPEAIYRSHKNYFDAGANIVITSTYQASLEGFLKRGLSIEQGKKLIRLAIELADNARNDYLEENPNGKAFVAASCGPYGAYLADGSEYRGDYSVSAKEVRALHSDRIKAIQEAAHQFDFWAVETLPSLKEALLVADILRGDPHPAWFSFTLSDEQHIADGVPLAEVAMVLEDIDAVAAVGVNCCHPAWVEPALKTLSRHTSKPLLAYPNGGGDYDPVTKKWTTPKEMEFDGAAWIAAGAKLIGGCCQTSSERLKPLYSDWSGSVKNN